MNTTTIRCGYLKCQCCKNSESRLVYILYPMDALRGWIESAAMRYGVSIVAVTGMDWDNDLTPWPAPGAPKGSPDFKGNAREFLDTLCREVLPKVESSLGIKVPIRRDLVGVSLSGLFTMWQWTLCDTFDNIASLSGSFWYKNFASWLASNPPKDKKGKAYLSLGNLESHTKIPAFKPVLTDTEKVVSILKEQGIETTFDIVPGNHYQYPIERLEKAFSSLY